MFVCYSDLRCGKSFLSLVFPVLEVLIAEVTMMDHCGGSREKMILDLFVITNGSYLLSTIPMFNFSRDT